MEARCVLYHQAGTWVCTAVVEHQIALGTEANTYRQQVGRQQRHFHGGHVRWRGGVRHRDLRSMVQDLLGSKATQVVLVEMLSKLSCSRSALGAVWKRARLSFEAETISRCVWSYAQVRYLWKDLGNRAREEVVGAKRPGMPCNAERPAALQGARVVVRSVRGGYGV